MITTLKGLVYRKKIFQQNTIRGWRLPGAVFSSDSPGQDHVFRHQRHSLGVDGAEQTVLEQSHHVGLGGLLQGHDSGALEPQIPATANLQC